MAVQMEVKSHMASRAHSMPGEMGNQTIELLDGGVEMWRDARAAFSDDDFGLVAVPQLAAYLAMIVPRRNEADDAAPLPRAAQADAPLAFRFTTGNQLIGHRPHPLRERLD